MKVGIDMVYIPRAKRLLETPEEARVLFHEEEMKHLSSAERVAGAIALKEAYFKACGKKKDWQSVRVAHFESGAPYLKVFVPEGMIPGMDFRIVETVSLSHDGEYAGAVVIIE